MLANTCHDLGHDGDVPACEAMLSACLVECTYDAGTPPDAGGDAGVPSDGGPDAPTDAGTEAVTLRFEGRVGSEPFACGTSYDLGNPPRDAEPVDFRFYVHDVRLLTAEGTEVPLEMDTGDHQAMGVALLDFEDATGACTGDATMNTEITGTAPAGEYTGVVFRIGVPLELNHVDLTTLPAPLNRTSLFWGWRLGHLFLAAVSRTETIGPAMPDAFDPDAGIDAGTMLIVTEHTTHVGSTMCVGNPEAGEPVTSCARPNRPEIRLTGFDPSSDAIAADFGEIKADVDVSGASCHSFSADCNFPFDALGLNWATGSVTSSTQTVFSVE